MIASRTTQLGMLLIALGWVQSASPNLLDIAIAAQAGIDGPWPTPFESPWTALTAWLIGAVAAGVALVSPTRRVATAYLVATVFLAAHRLTGDDATFFGGIWIASFIWWSVHTATQRPEHLARVGPRLAALILAAIFFPAGTGKAISAYLNGAHFADLAGPDFHPLPRALGIPIGPMFYRLFSWVGLFVELTAPLWPLLPPRIALTWVVCVCLSMMALWSPGLGSVLLPVMGVAVMALGFRTPARPAPPTPRTPVPPDVHHNRPAPP